MSEVQNDPAWKDEVGCAWFARAGNMIPEIEGVIDTLKQLEQELQSRLPTDDEKGFIRHAGLIKDMIYLIAIANAYSRQTADLAALRAKNAELEKVNQEIWARLSAEARAELNIKWKQEGRLYETP